MKHMKRAGIKQRWIIAKHEYSAKHEGFVTESPLTSLLDFLKCRMNLPRIQSVAALDRAILGHRGSRRRKYPHFCDG